jgi:hypothetical protein
MSSHLISNDQDHLRPPMVCLQMLGRRFPDIWPRLDVLRAEFVSVPNEYPPHWYLPYHAVAQTLDGLLAQMDRAGMNAPRFHVATVNMLIALSGWRVTQGVYRFDATLFDALIATPVSGQLPTDLLSKLPEWTVYIETPDMRWAGDALHGVFAQVGEMQDGAPCLCIVLHVETHLGGIILRLDQPSLEASLDIAVRHELNAGANPREHDIREVLPRIVSLLLYLCSEAAELGDGTCFPTKPVPRRTKKRTRMFPAERPTQWDVGMRMGAALRRAYQDDEAGRAGESSRHGSPRAHIRRAHWHTILSGSRRDPIRTLRWLPPIPVNGERIEDLVPTIRPVAAADVGH